MGWVPSPQLTYTLWHLSEPLKPSAIWAEVGTNDWKERPKFQATVQWPPPPSLRDSHRPAPYGLLQAGTTDQMKMWLFFFFLLLFFPENRVLQQEC